MATFYHVKISLQYHKELDRLVTGASSRKALALGIMDFSKQWMRFVMERCERGRGIKPRWASHGIDFLFLASSPNFTKNVLDEEFSEFKKLVEQCYSHVIGDVTSPGAMSPDPNRHSKYI